MVGTGNEVQAEGPETLKGADDTQLDKRRQKRLSRHLYSCLWRTGRRGVEDGLGAEKLTFCGGLRCRGRSLVQESAWRFDGVLMN